MLLCHLGHSAFGNCKRLKSVSVPDSVTDMGYAVFSRCESLKSVRLPKLRTIDYGMFYGCSALTSVDIPDSVVSIGQWAFRYCRQLASLSIPDSVTAIDPTAFEGCGSIRSLRIPDSGTSLWTRFSIELSGLEEITVGEGNESLSSRDGVLFSKDGTELIRYPAGRVEESYSIPGSVHTIADYAFSQCTKLVRIDFPESVRTVGEHTFSGCENLRPESVPEQFRPYLPPLPPEYDDSGESLCDDW